MSDNDSSSNSSVCDSSMGIRNIAFFVTPEEVEKNSKTESQPPPPQSSSHLPKSDNHLQLPDVKRTDSITSRGQERWNMLRKVVVSQPPNQPPAEPRLSQVVKQLKTKEAREKEAREFLEKFAVRNYDKKISMESCHNCHKNETRQSSLQKFFNRQGYKTIFDPRGQFYKYWLGIVSFAVLYNLWSCILRQGFRLTVTGHELYWFVFDGVADFIYVFDIVVQIRTTYWMEGLKIEDWVHKSRHDRSDCESSYQTQKKNRQHEHPSTSDSANKPDNRDNSDFDDKNSKLRTLLGRHYAHTKYMYMDLVSILPLDLFQFIIGIQPMIRFPRFLKVYRTLTWKTMIENHSSIPNAVRLINLGHLLLLGCHWFCCLYYILSEAEGFSTSWAYQRTGNDSLATKYIKSFYWATLTITTIGDLPPPEEDIEYIFTIVSYLIGVFVFAMIVGQIGNVITNRNAQRLEFEKILDNAKNYMRMHNVPKELQRRVLRWYDYAWSRGRTNGGGDINALGLLPDKLKTEMALHVNLETLKKVTIFQECRPEFLHDLVLKMRPFIFTPGDYICRTGEVAREMFIIADGLLQVISEQGAILTEMGAGDFFGEIGILNLDAGVNRRTANVKSVGYSELFVLSKDDVLAALKDHPDAETILARHGRVRLKNVKTSKSKDLSTPDSVTGLTDMLQIPQIPNSATKSSLTAAEVSKSLNSPSSAGLPNGSVETLLNCVNEMVVFRTKELQQIYSQTIAQLERENAQKQSRIEDLQKHIRRLEGHSCPVQKHTSVKLTEEIPTTSTSSPNGFVASEFEHEPESVQPNKSLPSSEIISPRSLSISHNSPLFRTTPHHKESLQLEQCPPTVSNNNSQLGAESSASIKGESTSF